MAPTVNHDLTGGAKPGFCRPGLQLQDHRQVEAAHSTTGGTVPLFAAAALAGHGAGVNALHGDGRPLGHLECSFELEYDRVC